MIWLRVFFVFSVCVFLISIIAYVRVNWSISAETAKEVITDEAERSEIPYAGVRFTPLTNKVRSPQNKGNADDGNGDGQQHKHRVPDFNGEQESVQFQSTKDQIESENEISEVDAAESSGRQVRIAELKRRIEWLSEQTKQLEEEEETLPPRYPPGQEPTRQTPEEMERDRKIDNQRREIRLKLVELGKEEYYLSRELRELQQEP